MKEKKGLGVLFGGSAPAKFSQDFEFIPHYDRTKRNKPINYAYIPKH